MRAPPRLCCVFVSMKACYACADAAHGLAAIWPSRRWPAERDSWRPCLGVVSLPTAPQTYGHANLGGSDFKD